MRFKFVPSPYSLAFALLGVVGFAGTASAGSTTGTMQVAADAQNTCYIQSAALDFGQIPAVINTPITGIANIDLQCSPDTSYSIKAGAGQHFTNLTQRNMEANGVLLAYNLYTDAGLTQSWGDINTVAGNPVTGNSGAVGGVTTIHAYGKILPGQIVPSNYYYDDVLLTAEFN